MVQRQFRHRAKRGAGRGCGVIYWAVLLARDNDSLPVSVDLVEPEEGGLRVTVQRHRPLILLLLFIAILGLLFFTYTSTQPQYEDSIGYIHAGERLAQGQGPTYEDPNNDLAGPFFSMYAFQIQRDDDSRMFLGYPPGYPLLIALGIIVSGTENAAHFVVPIFALVALAATFFLGHLLSRKEWAGFWAALIIGLTPVFWEFGTAAWSEIPATAILISGICLYLFSLESRRTRRQVIVLSLLAGLLITFSFYIRYANAVILPAILAYELLAKKWSIKKEPERWLFYALLGTGVIGILLFNNFYYGGPFLTSYSPEHGWYPNAPFSLNYILGPSFVGGRSLIEALKTLWANFPLLLILTPVGWFLLPRPSGVLAAVATLGFLALYSIYAFAPTGINSRFLLPAFPFIAVALSQCIVTVGKRIQSKQVRRLAGIALFVILILRVPDQVKALESREKASKASANYAQNIANRTEPEAVILTYGHNDQVIYFGDRSVLNYRRIPESDPAESRYRLEMLEPCMVESIDRLLLKNIPVYYVEDRSPPFWNSLAILQDNYELEKIAESPIMYRFTSTGERIDSTNDQEPFSCDKMP